MLALEYGIRHVDSFCAILNCEPICSRGNWCWSGHARLMIQIYEDNNGIQFVEV